MITESEWTEWLEHPCTKFVREIAQKRRQSIKDSWESGALRDQLDSAEALGACKALQMLEDLDYETAVESELTTVRRVGDDNGEIE